VCQGELHPAFHHGGQDGFRLGTIGDDARRHHRGQIGLHDQRLAEGLHHTHQIDRAAAEAAIVGRERQAGEAHLGQGRPYSRAPTRLGGNDLPARLEVIILGEEAPDRICEELLLFVVIEVHKPNVIFAMMLRWISFDPA
jgi:hypothetical protein